jgi:aconitate hydratase
MGVLPLQFPPGESAESLGLTGREVYDVRGLAGGLRPLQQVTVEARRDDGSTVSFQAVVRIDGPVEVDYYRHGGILRMVLRQMLEGETSR